MSLVNNPEIIPLLSPIHVDDPIGSFSEENEIYTLLEDEMVKLGGLHDASIDWQQIEGHSKRYLQEHCKHFRVASYLIQCWLRQGNWGSWYNACDLLTGFCETYFLTAFPKPGKSGLHAKRKLVLTLIERLKGPLDSLLETQQDKGPVEKAADALTLLKKIASDIVALSDDDLSTIDSLQKKIDKRLKTPQSSPNRPIAPRGQHDGKAINSSFFTSAQHSSSSVTNERELRKTLLAIAQSANQQDTYDPVGYQLRRYALWGPITSSPLTVKENQTELMPVPAVIVEEYQRALDKNRVDPALLQRVENSVISSIYWLKGSYFACQFAKRLEMNEVSNAIWNASSRFVTRLPILLKLQFSDGTPFADEVTTEWLSSAPMMQTSISETLVKVHTDYLELQKKLTKQMETEGIESVLKELEKQANTVTSPRNLCHFMKITADLLREEGLNWLANDIYQRIEKNMTTTKAAEWEPELFTQISIKAGIPVQTKNDRGGR